MTTVGQCGEECRLAGTVRLVEGIEWMPELSDHNTREWYQLAAIVEQSVHFKIHKQSMVKYANFSPLLI